MKTISIFLALINSLIAGLIILYNLSVFPLHEGDTFVLFVESVVDISIIIVGVLMWVACIKAIHPGPVLISGLYLVVLGAVTIFWTYHHAVLSGHIQFAMIIFGASLMAQGMASLLGFSAEPQSMTTS